MLALHQDRCKTFVCQQDKDSPGQKKGEDVSAVSQAWFTTKEDKDTLVNKGKFGIFCIYTDLYYHTNSALEI